MEPFEVRELRYFVAVAEELNFSRAAARLGIAQPPLSRAIRLMERRLGAELFHRDTHKVTLSTVGATLLAEARTALDAVAAATHRTQRAALPTPTLVATAKPGVATRMLRQIVDAYAAVPGNPEVHIVVSGYGHQADLLRDGRADVALLSSPYERPWLEAEPLTTEPRVAALPAGHPLTRRAVLHCADLAGEPIPRWEREGETERAYWSGRDVGPRSWAQPLEPVAGPVVRDTGQLLDVVSLGQAVALVPRSIATENQRPDLAYLPVADASPYTIAVAWPAGSRSQPVAQFVRTAIQLAERPWRDMRPDGADDEVPVAYPARRGA
jgi:LysR family transcriptional regulator, benzoate and cis,cis-muconate-responsive activator of ben and cat genes